MEKWQKKQRAKQFFVNGGKAKLALANCLEQTRFFVQALNSVIVEYVVDERLQDYVLSGYMCQPRPLHFGWKHLWVKIGENPPVLRASGLGTRTLKVSNQDLWNFLCKENDAEICGVVDSVSCFVDSTFSDLLRFAIKKRLVEVIVPSL